jgi:putative flippase GtrA
MKSDWHRVPWFLVVGGAAAAVHLGVVALLVEQFSWKPTVANVAGFLIAFIVSFCGHYFLTFRDLQASLWPAIQRFFAIAVLGFAINQIFYMTLLVWIDQRMYLAALLCVLVGVAVLTFFLSRRWGFSS